MSRVGRYLASGGVILDDAPLEALVYDAKRGVLLSRLRVLHWFRVYVERNETPPAAILEFVAEALGGVLDGEWGEFKANAYRIFNPLGRSRLPNPDFLNRARPATDDRRRSFLEFGGKDVTRNVEQQRERQSRLWRVQELLLDLRDLPDRARVAAVVSELETIYAEPINLV